MATSRKILVVSALALACHFAALAVHSALASSIIEFVLIVLTAAACFQASGRASGFARRFWRLMGHGVCAVLSRPSAPNLLRQRNARIAEGLVPKRRSFPVSLCADGIGPLLGS